MEKRILPAGDSAMVVEFGTEIDDEINKHVMILSKLIKEKKIKGVREVLPTFRSLMIFYDYKKISFGKLKRIVEKMETMQGNTSDDKFRTLLVPCCYDQKFGLDLEDMTALCDLSKEEIIKLHSEVDYKIYMLGFLPGFVYLGGLNPKICAPRLNTPRTKIPKGSVGIGGTQTGVYPVDSPGGWRLIGSTPIDFYNPKLEKPILCNAGEKIKFVPISAGEYDQIKNDVEKGTYIQQYL